MRYTKIDEVMVTTGEILRLRKENQQLRCQVLKLVAQKRQLRKIVLALNAGIAEHPDQIPPEHHQ